MQRQYERSAARAEVGQRRERRVDRDGKWHRHLVLDRGAGAGGKLRRVDKAEEQGDLLVSNAGRRQIAEQLDQALRLDADFLDAFAPRGLRRGLALLEVACDDFD